MPEIFIQALIGGAMLGAGALLLMLTLGKIAGISGITAGALLPKGSERGWKLAFLVGLIIAPILTSQLGFGLPEALPGSSIALAIAGLLVGFGARLGSGCTSGHGICGIGRLSKRSIVATITFMSAAIVTVTVVGVAA